MLFSFSHPQYLFLLLIIPLFFIIHFYSLGNKKRVALNFANFDAIARIKGIDFFSKNIINLILNSLIILLLVFAFSGLTVQVSKKASSFSFFVIIDSSQSMETDDFYPDRVTVAKEVAIEFVDKVPLEVRIGIVSFSGNAYVEQDLSDDKTEVKNSISNIKVEGWGGTDLYEAVITSSKLLSDEEYKAIILLSDGQINVGKLEDIINYAQRNDIIIHSIAIGTRTKEGEEISYAISELDEDFLKSISYNTGGIYSFAGDKSALSQSFLDISNLTTKKVSIKFFNYLILAVIVLFIIEFFLINTRYFNLI